MKQKEFIDNVMTLLFGIDHDDIPLDPHAMYDLAFNMIKEKYKDKDVSLPVITPVKDVEVMYKEVRQGQL